MPALVDFPLDGREAPEFVPEAPVPVASELEVLDDRVRDVPSKPSVFQPETCSDMAWSMQSWIRFMISSPRSPQLLARTFESEWLPDAWQSASDTVDRAELGIRADRGLGRAAGASMSGTELTVGTPESWPADEPTPADADEPEVGAVCW